MLKQIKRKKKALPRLQDCNTLLAVQDIRQKIDKMAFLMHGIHNSPFLLNRKMHHNARMLKVKGEGSYPAIPGVQLFHTIAVQWEVTLHHSLGPPSCSNKDDYVSLWPPSSLATIVPAQQPAHLWGVEFYSESIPPGQHVAVSIVPVQLEIHSPVVQSFFQQLLMLQQKANPVAWKDRTQKEKNILLLPSVVCHSNLARGELKIQSRGKPEG